MARFAPLKKNKFAEERISQPRPAREPLLKPFEVHKIFEAWETLFKNSASEVDAKSLIDSSVATRERAERHSINSPEWKRLSTVADAQQKAAEEILERIKQSNLRGRK